MGAWGARIFEDDMALDVRGDFLEQHRAGKSVSEVEKYIRDEYIEDNEYYDDVVKLALCCVELETGTLTTNTTKDALEVIESGRNLKTWREESDPHEAGLRSHELTLIKKYIKSYDGQPVKRKSWAELQRNDQEVAPESVPEEEKFELDKLDEIGWHIQDAKAPDEETQMAQAGAHIACFVYWLITRDYFQPFEEHEDSATAIAMVKSGELSPIQFLEDEMDEQLFVGFAKPEVRVFVKDYYDDRYERFFYDFLEVLCDERDLYSFIPSYNEYEKMAHRIDERLKKFRAR